MIIHSHDYFVALRAELNNMLNYVNGQVYAHDAVFLKDGINKELAVVNIVMENVNCMSCVNKRGEISREGIACKGSLCTINGPFPEGFNASSYSCPLWVWDDLPF